MVAISDISYTLGERVDRTTLIMAVGVFAAVFLGAMWLVPGHGTTASPLAPAALTAREQAEMDELKHDPDDPNLTTLQQYRIKQRRELIRTYPLAAIDAAEDEAPRDPDGYLVAVATPPDGYQTLDILKGTQAACVAWRQNGETMHELYYFKPGFVGSSDIVLIQQWMETGCAAAIAKSGETVTHRRMLQDLMDRIPQTDDYTKGRAEVRERLAETGPVHPMMRGVDFFP